MKLYIKNMVCERCKMVIANVLQDLNLMPITIELGEVDFGATYGESFSIEKQTSLQVKLEAYGFELLNNKTSQLIEKVKSVCIEYVKRRHELEGVNLSAFLTEQLPYEYNHLSQLFSSVEGVTIEQFYIQQRVEKVKELLVYDELSLSEIAYQLGYSSVAHLSGQFKKVSGLTATHFRSLKDAKQRHSLDKL